MVGLRANLDSRDYAYTLTPLDKQEVRLRIQANDRTGLMFVCAHSNPLPASVSGRACSAYIVLSMRNGACNETGLAIQTHISGVVFTNANALIPFNPIIQAAAMEDTHLLFGSLKTHKLVQTLATYGIRDVRISNDNGEETIELGSLGARIIVGCDRTLIETGGNESLRLMLRDAVVSLLTEL